MKQKYVIALYIRLSLELQDREFEYSQSKAAPSGKGHVAAGMG